MTGGISLAIEIEDTRWNDIAGIERLLTAAAAATLPAGETREIACLLTDDQSIKDINKRWRGQDKPTNVLSFPAAQMALPPGEPQPLGDVVMAFETVERESRDSGKVLEHHVSHLMVHGILHLLGYDHGTDAEAEIMENKERAILASLGITDPYKNER
jgi:probable rRNA maturation factor